MKSLGIYVQVPFCSSKCSFCNFSSQVVRANVFDWYRRALLEEIARLPAIFEEAGVGNRTGTSRLHELPVDTLYFGGGTPSLLGAQTLGRIVLGIGRQFRVGDLLEFTIEITPGSAGDDFLRGARSLGINRLSIGAQSFSDDELRSVGRLHSAADTSSLVHDARRLGFENISLDLIAGLPHQTETSWQHTLCEAVRLQPEHLSVYLFEIDEKSRLGREALRHGTRYHAGAVPDDEFMADAYETARSFLANQGYTQYEISNFARPGYASRHNRKYWQLEPYIGVGAGAHSFDGNCRWANETAVESYELKIESGHSPIAEIRMLSSEEQIEEFFFLGLRQRTGVDLRFAGERWGSAPLSRWEETISTLTEQGWLERQKERVRIPERAYLVSNEIFEQFLSS